MNNKLKLLTIALVATLAGIVTAEVYTKYTIQQEATVGQISLAITINDVLWDGETIDWGNPTPGDAITKTLVIENTDSLTCTLTMETTGLPTEWTQTMTLDTDTITTGETATGTLTLTIPTTATSGVYSWTMTITGTA